MEITKTMKKYYLKNNGGNCPHCKEPEVSIGDISHTEVEVYT